MTLALHYFQLSPDAAAPLYQQIQDNLIELIDHQLLVAGDALPSERQLGEAYGVNRMTVRQAVDGLVQKGLIVRRQGAGTFVTDRKPLQTITPTVAGFSQRMREAGMTPSSRVLERAAVPGDPILAHQLKLEAGQEVIMLKRLRLADDEPLMIETSYLSARMFPGLLEADFEDNSLYDILQESYGMAVVEAEHTLEPTILNAYEAQTLGLEVKHPAMLVRVVAYARDHVPVEMSKSIVRGDRCRFLFRVHTGVPIVQ